MRSLVLTGPVSPNRFSNHYLIKALERSNSAFIGVLLLFEHGSHKFRQRTATDYDERGVFVRFHWSKGEQQQENPDQRNARTIGCPCLVREQSFWEQDVNPDTVGQLKALRGVGCGGLLGGSFRAVITFSQLMPKGLKTL